MPQIQFELSEEEDKKLEYIKIAKNLKTKAEAIKLLINEKQVDIKIK